MRVHKNQNQNSVQLNMCVYMCVGCRVRLNTQANIAIKVDRVES